MIWLLHCGFTTYLAAVTKTLRRKKTRLLPPLPGFSSSGHFKTVTISKRSPKDIENLNAISKLSLFLPPELFTNCKCPRIVEWKRNTESDSDPTSFDELSLDIKMSWSCSSCSIRIRSYELCSIHPFPGHGDFGFCITAYENSIWITSRNQDSRNGKASNQINKTHRCDIALPS